MDFIQNLFFSHSIAQIMIVFSAVIALGLALGSIKICGIRLGIAGVLFSGLIFGHFGMSIEHETMHFAKEFGLILFVYTIGIQVGPGFFASFKKNGIKFNMLAAFIVIFGAIIAISIIKFGGVPTPAGVGLFSGSTTNTPSLGAAQQILQDIDGITQEQLTLPGLGYAVAYPFGILGIIINMLLLRWLFKISIKKEEECLLDDQAKPNRVMNMDVKIENPNLDGVKIEDLPLYKSKAVIISRIQKGNTILTAKNELLVNTGDLVRVVGDKDKLKEFKLAVGSEHRMEMRGKDSNVVMRKVVITHNEINGVLIRELNTIDNYNVHITRVTRSEVEFIATPDTTLQFGDELRVVGKLEDIETFAKTVGNSAKSMDHPALIPIFLGILAGVFIGSIPIQIPGVPSAVKLGLAGGPLVVAIILSRIGYIGKLNWYMPPAANFMLREVGITLFLACVGLGSGGSFVKTITQGDGLLWMGLATIITFVPLFCAALIGRIFLKLNYLTICGVLAGSMTDPPALAYATSLSKTNGASVGYATVYPLTMLLRVLCAQLIVIYFF